MITDKENAILIDEDGSQWVTVKQAAALVGVSASTMRRKGKAGEIQGKMVPSPAGDTFYLLLEDVERVKSAFTMLTVKKEASNQEMAFAVSHMVGQYLQERDNVVLDKLAEIENNHTAQIQGLQDTIAAMNDKLQALTEKANTEAPRSLFQRIFNK